MPSQWPGLAERIAQRVKALGFDNLSRFSDATGIRITYIYKWAAGTTPDRQNLEKLAKHLKVHPAWLLFGDEVRPFLRVLVVALLGTSLLGLHEPAHARSVLLNITNASYRQRRYRGWWATVKITTRFWSGFDPTPTRGFPRIDRIGAVA